MHDSVAIVQSFAVRKVGTTPRKTPKAASEHWTFYSRQMGGSKRRGKSKGQIGRNGPISHSLRQARTRHGSFAVSCSSPSGPTCQPTERHLLSSQSASAPSRNSFIFTVREYRSACSTACRPCGTVSGSHYRPPSRGIEGDRNDHFNWAGTRHHPVRARYRKSKTKW